VGKTVSALNPRRARENGLSVAFDPQEGLPAKRIYAWADILQVPRDAFFRFVTGEADAMETGKAATSSANDKLSQTEADLLAAYRRLPPKYQRRLREQAEEYETLARAQRRANKVLR
jgi:hypothetical protein